MRNAILALLAGMMLLALSCGGGGSETSSASRFTGNWTGTLVETQRDDGRPLETANLRMHMEYAGKEKIGGITVEYISFSVWIDDVLFPPGIGEALPGGVLVLEWKGGGALLRINGQFTGNVASGSWANAGPDPEYPWVTRHVYGTWSATRA